MTGKTMGSQSGVISLARQAQGVFEQLSRLVTHAKEETQRSKTLLDRLRRAERGLNSAAYGRPAAEAAATGGKSSAEAEPSEAPGDGMDSVARRRRAR